MRRIGLLPDALTTDGLTWIILSKEGSARTLDLRARFIRKILFGASASLLAACLVAQDKPPDDDVARESTKFTQVYGILEQNFMDELEPDRTLFDGGIRGMLARLDPFSVFFDRAQFKLLEEQARGRALGFGSILYVQPGKIVVLQTAEGSPSWRAGLSPGDEIVEINGTRIDRLEFSDLVELLQRSRSQPVRLGVIRPSKVVAQDFELKPAEVAMPTVDRAFLLKPELAYIHFASFEQKTSQEIADALTKLGGPRLKGLLLDLRDNRGGMLDAAIRVASLFLEPDQLVLTVRGRATAEKTYRTSPASSHFDLPLIVLVNGNTASAAEVLVAALQEHDRALVSGETTFGKGVVETVWPLGEKTGLALTTAQYFTPSGRSIQRPLPGTALTFATASAPASDPAAFRTDSGRAVQAGGGITPDVAIPARELDPWAVFLNQRGFFTRFASDYITLHGKVAKDFEPDPTVLENFRDFLAKERIRAPEEYWGPDQGYLKLRIKTELFNLVFGLSSGDEVEVRGDAQVQKAAALFPKIAQLLRLPVAKPARARRVVSPDRSKRGKKAVGGRP